MYRFLKLVLFTLDINECCTGNGNNAPVQCQGVSGAPVENTNDCNETKEECVDTSGSYYCRCKDGYHHPDPSTPSCEGKTMKFT